VQQRARAEVEALHAFFEDWFCGRADELSPCEAALAEGFEIVSPNGTTHGRELLLESLRAAKGTHAHHDFRMWVSDVQARDLGGGLLLVTYEEWHEQDGARKGRSSTAVLRENAERPRGLEWLHVHETWLEA
jgi:hypothetical protein